MATVGDAGGRVQKGTLSLFFFDASTDSGKDATPAAREDDILANERDSALDRRRDVPIAEREVISFFSFGPGLGGAVYYLKRVGSNADQLPESLLAGVFECDDPTRVA